MGADLIATWMTLLGQPDYDAAAAAIEQLSDEDLLAAYEGDTGWEAETPAEAREYARTMLTNLREDTRSVLFFKVGGPYYLLLAGGTSHGDSPSPGFDGLGFLLAFPAVVTALGGIIDTDGEMPL